MRVLIVDDEPIVRRLHEASLTGWGYQVTSASSGEQAWELFQNADPLGDYAVEATNLLDLPIVHCLTLVR